MKYAPWSTLLASSSLLDLSPEGSITKDFGKYVQPISRPVILMSSTFLQYSELTNGPLLGSAFSQATTRICQGGISGFYRRVRSCQRLTYVFFKTGQVCKNSNYRTR